MCVQIIKSENAFTTIAQYIDSHSTYNVLEIPLTYCLHFLRSLAIATRPINYCMTTYLGSYST